MPAGVIGLDPLSGAHLSPHPYLLLLTVMQLIGAPWLLPPLLALLLLLLLYLFFSKVIEARAVVVLILLILVLCPGISILATHHAPVLLCMVFVAAAMLLSEHSGLLSLMLGLAIITSAPLGAVTAVVFAVRFFRMGKYPELTRVAIACAAAFVWFLLWKDLPGLHELLSMSFNPKIFFELGDMAGVSLFLLIIAGYGIVVQAKNQDLVLYSLLLFAAGFFIPLLLPAATVMLAMFAAQGVYHLMTSRWDLELLQSSLLVLVSCIGLFLLITVVRERTSEAPDADFAHLMITLRNEHREGAVLTDPSYAPMVEYFSGRKATLSAETPQPIVDQFLHSRTPTQVYAVMAETNTSYVLLTADMERNLFTRSDDGILFLLHNTERFVQISQTDGGTLWYFIGAR